MGGTFDEQLFGGQNTIRISETTGGTSSACVQRSSQPNQFNFSKMLKSRMLAAFGNKEIETADLFNHRTRLNEAQKRSRDTKIKIKEYPQTMEFDECRGSIDTLVRKSGMTSGTGRINKDLRASASITKGHGDQLVTLDCQNSNMDQESTIDNENTIMKNKTPSIAVLATSKPGYACSTPESRAAAYKASYLERRPAGF